MVFSSIFLAPFTKKLAGFSEANQFRTELVLRALEMDLGRENLIQGYQLIGHSGRNCQSPIKYERSVLAA